MMRARVSVLVGLLVALVAVAAWFWVVAPLLSIGSVYMGLAVSGLAVLGGAVAALATYWGTE